MAAIGRTGLARFQIGRRTTGQSACRTHVDLASTAPSAGANPDGGTVFYLHRRLRVLVLDANNAAATHRVD